MSSLKRLGGREVHADDLHDAKAFVLKVNQSSDELLRVYLNLYNTLNELYAEYPQMYAEIQRTVELPTNDDATRITKLNADLKTVLEYMNDDVFLKTIVDDVDVNADDDDL